MATKVGWSMSFGEVQRDQILFSLARESSRGDLTPVRNLERETLKVFYM